MKGNGLYRAWSVCFLAGCWAFYAYKANPLETGSHSPARIGADAPASIRATCVIRDNDPPPELSVDDVSVPEGNSGPTIATLTLSLSSPSGWTATVDLSTADESASVVGGDYESISRTLVFASGVTSLSVQARVNGDSNVEPDETFCLNLSNPQHVTLLRSQARVTILNDDQPSPPPLKKSSASRWSSYR
ncbi:MAG: hypothetical protein NTW86_14735 [Candidatus Sumerlaeota bacterium]|nr:hypothetical protein [Candidatus Sumerlaeota bacterium]